MHFYLINQNIEVRRYKMKKLDLHNPIGTESRLYFKGLLITHDIQRT